MSPPSFFAPNDDVYPGASQQAHSSAVLAANRHPPPHYQRSIPIPTSTPLPDPTYALHISYGSIDATGNPLSSKSCSLPGYQACETILLLEPPRYSSCPCNAEALHHAHDRCGKADRLSNSIVTLLIVLNVLVWTAVIWGLCVEWTPSTVGG